MGTDKVVIFFVPIFMYDKPTMAVYLLKTKSELLQSSAPIYDDETGDQW